MVFGDVGSTKRGMPPPREGMPRNTASLCGPDLLIIGGGIYRRHSRVDVEQRRPLGAERVGCVGHEARRPNAEALATSCRRYSAIRRRSGRLTGAVFDRTRGLSSTSWRHGHGNAHFPSRRPRPSRLGSRASSAWRHYLCRPVIRCEAIIRWPCEFLFPSKCRQVRRRTGLTSGPRVVACSRTTRIRARFVRRRLYADFGPRLRRRSCGPSRTKEPFESLARRAITLS